MNTQLQQASTSLSRNQREKLASEIFSRLIADGYALRDIVGLSSQLVGLVSEQLRVTQPKSNG